MEMGFFPTKLVAKMSLVPCMVYCFHLFNAQMSLSKGCKVITLAPPAGPMCYSHAQKN